MTDEPDRPNHPHSPETNESGEVIAARDWLGNRFAVGERVLYCVGAGRGQLMAIGTVQRIWLDSQGWRAMHIKVSVLTERTSGEWGNGKRSRPAAVNPLNITALTTLDHATLK